MFLFSKRTPHPAQAALTVAINEKVQEVSRLSASTESVHRHYLTAIGHVEGLESALSCLDDGSRAHTMVSALLNAAREDRDYQQAEWTRLADEQMARMREYQELVGR